VSCPTAADFSGKKVGGGGGEGNWEEGHGKDRHMDELSDKLAQTEATVTQLKSKLLQLQDMNINGEMLINKKQQLVRKLEDQVRGHPSIPCGCRIGQVKRHPSIPCGSKNRSGLEVIQHQFLFKTFKY